MDYNVDNSNDFSYDYEEYKDDVKVEYNKNKKDTNKLKYIIIGLVALILLIGLILFLINILNRKGSSITLTITEKLDLYIGETKKIEVSVNGIDDANPKLVFMSQDETIAKVSDTGVVSAISDGTTNIIVAYYDEQEKTYSKNCMVSVVQKNEEQPPLEEPSDEPIENENQDLNFKYSLPSSSNGWYKGNVVISLSYNKDFLKSLKYALDCEKNCNYKDITGSNKIAITGTGTKKVVIIATDKNGKEVKKTLSIKIDKTAPIAKLNTSTIIYNNTGKVEVCVSCTDSLSGCVESKVCYTHTESVNSSSLIVYDKAGNKATSDSYKVIIDKEKPTCSLKYSDKKIVATVNDTGGSGLLYYGFNNNYSGTNSKEKTNISAGNYTYYVKDRAGNTNSCSLTCSFGSWYKSGYQASVCTPYSKAEAERDGATWYRVCVNGVSQEYARSFSCN